MAETKIEVKIKSSDLIYNSIIRLLNSILEFLTLRKGRKFWGIVYDSVTKQPLDPVIVKLSYVHNEAPVQTCVTDMFGRYGFLAVPGKFKIFAKKSNFSFPSTKITTENDGGFTHVYRGEFFELSDDAEVVAPNIPMDPVNFDWNQQAKLKVVKTHPVIKNIFRKTVRFVFWVGFVVTAAYSVYYYPTTPYLENLQNFHYILFLYLFLFLMNATLPELRLWGRMMYKNKKLVFGGAEMYLSNPAIESVVLSKAVTMPDGRFLIRANPGDYILKVIINNTEGSVPVTIHKEGVLNSDIYIKPV